MFYSDGPPVDKVGKITECPVCNNEELSKGANHCRICGLSLANRCEGIEEYDGYNNREMAYHDNPANARFCEICGVETQFFRKGILKPWNEAKEFIEANSENFPAVQTPSPTDATQQATMQHIDEDDDLPF